MRDALRSLTSSPGPAAAAVVTLALAIGMNAGMIGLVDRAFLSPPPHLLQPDRLVNLGFELAGGRGRMTSASYPAYRTLRDEVSGFAGAAAWQPTSTSIIVDGEQVHADGMIVSGNYFEVLGAAAAFGRAIQPADDRASAEPVVVLSHSFWQGAFGGSRAVLGRHVSIGGLEYVIGGVTPAGFSGHTPANVDVWIPFAAAMRLVPGWDRQPYMNIASVVARLAPGTTPAAAAAQASAVSGGKVVALPLTDAGTPSTERRVAMWLAAVSALVLAVGLANAATLLLVRARRRRREFAIRTALGASRGQLLRQALAEAGLIAVPAVALSLLMAIWFDAAVRAVLLPGVAPLARVNGAAVVAAVLGGAVAALVGALAGAVHLPRALQASSLAGGEHGTGRRSRVASVLLVVQTALSVVLLAGAGLFGRSLHNLTAQDFGLRMDGVFVVDFEEGAGGGGRGEDVFGAALDRVRALPGVRAATVIGALPFAAHMVPPIAVPGRAEPPNVDGQLPFLQPATPEFFDILGVRIVEGRALTAADDHGQPVVVVNETMARALWPGESAIGKCIRIGFDPSFDPATATGPPTPSAAVPCRRIVGVAHDMRQRSLVPDGAEARLMQYFVPYSQVPVPPFIPDPDHAAWGLLVQAAASGSVSPPAIRRAVSAGRSDLPFVRVRPYAQLLERQLRPWRLGTTLLTWFGALALAIGTLGLYAAFAHAVARRRREMAIRVAVGARPAGIVALVLREALRLSLMGTACGLGVALAGGRVLQSLWFQTSAADPLVLAGAAAIMCAVAAAATWLPARAASRANPATLLRS